MGKRLLLLFCWLVSAKGQAQEVMHSGQFFDNTLQLSQSLRHGYDRQRLTRPWIEAYEFRTETDEFDFERQEYLLRFTPTSFGVRKAQSALFNHYRQKLSLVESNYVDEQLEEAYYLWAALYIQAQKLAIYQTLRSISQDKQTIYRQQARMPDFDYTELVDIQQEINDLNVRISQFEIAARALKTQAQLGAQRLAFEDMIDVDQMAKALDSNLPVDISDAEYAYENALLDKEIALEKAEKRKIFDFVQVRYSGPHDDWLGERVAVGAALKIPTSGDRNLRIEERRIEQQELALEAKISGQKTTDKIRKSILEIRSKIEMYKTLEKASATEAEEYEAIAKFVAQAQGEDPLLLLDINENIQKAELEKVKYLEEIYQEYIAYLALSGKLFVRPFKNYLAE